MCSRNELSVILKKLATAYRDTYGDAIEQILLYGSYARGDNEDDSDIDVVAIVHGDRDRLQQQLKSIWDYSADLELEHETVLSPTVIPYEEYERYKDDLPYYKNIAREGGRSCCLNPQIIGRL